jgi:hypothetical protein
VTGAAGFTGGVTTAGLAGKAGFGGIAAGFTDRVGETVAGSPGFTAGIDKPGFSAGLPAGGKSGFLFSKISEGLLIGVTETGDGKEVTGFFFFITGFTGNAGFLGDFAPCLADAERGSPQHGQNLIT